MSARNEVAEALAAMGQLGGEGPSEQRLAIPPELAPDAGKPLKARRSRRLVALLAIVALLGGAGYWQRERLLTAATKVPLVGPLVRERQQAVAEPVIDPLGPERAALSQQERAVLQREQDLLRAEADLIRRQEALDAREAALVVAEEELADREEALLATLPGPGIDELVDIYRNMKADAAAERLALLDNLTAITVLQQVDRQLAARMLAAMDADRAAELSRSLAAQGGP